MRPRQDFCKLDDEAIPSRDNSFHYKFESLRQRRYVILKEDSKILGKHPFQEVCNTILSPHVSTLLPQPRSSHLPLQLVQSLFPQYVDRS